MFASANSGPRAARAVLDADSIARFVRTGDPTYDDIRAMVAAAEVVDFREFA